MAKAHPIDGLEVDLHWPDSVKPENWRDAPDADEPENDEEGLPTPPHVIAMLGFDPAEFD